MKVNKDEFRECFNKALNRLVNDNKNNNISKQK